MKSSDALAAHRAEPRTEFRGLIEAEILKALADPNATNSVSAEVARLIADYAVNLGTQAKARWPIETVAMRLTMDAREDTRKRPELSMQPQAIIKRAIKKQRRA